MSDNAEIVREALADPDCPTVKITAALAALDEMEAIVAERHTSVPYVDRLDAALAERDEMEARWQYAQQTRAEAMALWKAVEAERDEAVDQAGTWRDHFNTVNTQLEAAEADAKRLREALGEMHRLIRTRRVSLHMDGTETFAVPILSELNAIAQAALSGDQP